jgi:hypothetical protein
MNRVDRSEAYARSGMSIIGDRPGEGRTPPPVALDISDDDFVPEGLQAWAGRVTNGFYVQGLVDAEGTTFISAGIAGRNLHQTWEVPREKALDAFLHPFANGCTLPL